MAEVAPVPAVAKARRKAADVGEIAEAAEAVPFAELVLAHYLRQIEVFRNRSLEGPWEEKYRDKLRAFTREKGRIVNAYWCTREPSGAAVTERRLRPRFRRWRRDSILRLHSETNWITRDAPEIADELHHCDTLAIRISEVLRGTSELVALQWLLAAVGRLLAFVDQEEERPLDSDKTKSVVQLNRAELKEIEHYYNKQGEDQARLVYFGGMIGGAGILALLMGLVLGILYATHFSHWDSAVTHNILIAVAMGAAGAIISVMSRMAGRNAFSIDHEVGRKTVRRLGSFRPFIGAMFAIALYFGLTSDVIKLGVEGQRAQSIYFYAIVSFLAGFSERWARVALGRAANDDAEPPRAQSTETR